MPQWCNFLRQGTIPWHNFLIAQASVCYSEVSPFDFNGIQGPILNSLSASAEHQCRCQRRKHAVKRYWGAEVAGAGPHLSAPKFSTNWRCYGVPKGTVENGINDPPNDQEGPKQSLAQASSNTPFPCKQYQCGPMDQRAPFLPFCYTI